MGLKYLVVAFDGNGNRVKEVEKTTRFEADKEITINRTIDLLFKRVLHYEIMEVRI